MRGTNRWLKPTVVAGVAITVIPLTLAAWVIGATAMAEQRARTYRPSGRINSSDPSTRPALVVFGAQALPDGPSAELRMRLDHAIRLWHRGTAPVIVMTGGVADGVDEVAIMTDYAVAQGVAPDAVMPARPGQNTKEQVKSTLHIASAQRLGPLVAVSSSYHALRVEDQARQHGARIRTSGPVIPYHQRERWSRILIEAGGVVWYHLPSFITDRVDTSVGTIRHRLPHVLAGRLPFSAMLPGHRASTIGKT